MRSILARVDQVLMQFIGRQTCIYTQSAHTAACRGSRLPSCCRISGPPNFCCRRKSAEEYCGRRKRRRICKIRSARKNARKPSSEIALFTKLRTLLDFDDLPGMVYCNTSHTWNALTDFLAMNPCLFAGFTWIYVEWCTFAYLHVRHELSRIFVLFF